VPDQTSDRPTTDPAVPVEPGSPLTRTDRVTSQLTRRHLGRNLAGLAVAGAAAPLVAGCGSDDDTAGRSAPAAGDTTVGAATTLGPTSDVPVGGGRIYTDPPVVVTQPKAEEFHAFSSFCTHRGCPVSDVSDGLIQCACHGSQYSLTDGSVVRGPAPDPLVRLDLDVAGGEVSVSGV
jgi:nitrite reductase/ring-hydroxylating ferredoxin subunit